MLAMIVFAASLQGWFFCRSRLWESAVLMMVALTMLRPGFLLDLVHPPFDSVDPVRVLEFAEERRDGGALRMRMRGEKFGGSIGERIVVFDLGKKGAPGAERLEKASGMTLRIENARVFSDNVQFGSPAEKQGIDFDWQILEVQIRADRMPKEWFILPAFMVLCGISFLQIRRKRRGGAVETTATVRRETSMAKPTSPS